MKEHATPEIVANTIEMWREQYKGAFIIVEGDEDARFYECFFDKSQCRAVPADGIENVISVLEILEKHHFIGLVAIVDADFCRPECVQPSSSNLIFTDTHDLETMLLASPALDKVLQIFGSSKKLAALPKDARALLIESGLPLGYLRWASLKFGLFLRFEDLRFKRFVDAKTLAIDPPHLIHQVCAHSQRPDLDVDDIQYMMDLLKDPAHNPWEICCGPDLVSILSIGLGKMLGSHNTGEIHPSKINKSLRLAYEKKHFQCTSLYSAIKQWQQRNRPFRLLQ